jgi:DNA-binding response OmpR family regulator
VTPPVRPSVLLVDDDPDICDFLATLLDLEGLEPRVAAGAEEALLAAPGAALALIDVAMPGVDGFTLCRRLRAAGFVAPIVLASARPGPELPRQALEAGADQFLRKPFDNVELVARLRLLIESTAR